MPCPCRFILALTFLGSSLFLQGCVDEAAVNNALAGERLTAIRAACKTAMDTAYAPFGEKFAADAAPICAGITNTTKKTSCSAYNGIQQQGIVPTVHVWEENCADTLNANATTIQPIVNSTALSQAVDTWMAANRQPATDAWNKAIADALALLKKQADDKDFEWPVAVQIWQSLYDASAAVNTHAGKPSQFSMIGFGIVVMLVGSAAFGTGRLLKNRWSGDADQADEEAQEGLE